MKKVNLDELPRKTNGNISWVNSVGCHMTFVYNNIEGELEIVGVEKDKRTGETILSVKYNHEIHRIIPSKIKKGLIGTIFDKERSGCSHRYKVGDIVELDKCRLKILSTTFKERSKGIRAKSYEYICLNSGRRHEILESKLVAGQGCGVCKGYHVLVGVNDIQTLAPQMIDLLTDKNDATKYRCQSNKKISFTCPCCGHEKVDIIGEVYRHGLKCPNCIGGISYPEYFVSLMIKQLEIRFQTQYRPTWSQGRRYDFYLPDYNMIIETHGAQHYEDCKKWTRFSLEEQQEIDRLKKELAYQNGINKYVVLDCRESKKEWLTESILNSELSKLFQLSDINWSDIHWQALNNDWKVRAVQMWNNGDSTTEIAESLGVTSTTIVKYLKGATDKGLCEYDSLKYLERGGRRLMKPPSIKVMAIKMETQEEFLFESVTECIDTLRAKENTSFVQKTIRAVCKGERDSYKGYIFKEVK